MGKKYKILSTSSIFPISISFLKKEEEIDESKVVTIRANIDYSNNRVYFDPLPEECADIDLVSMEEEILDFIRPPEIDTPEIVYELLEKARQVSSGDFASSFMKDSNLGGNYDSR